MAVTIRLARVGKKNNPFFRIVAADSRKPRDGRFIEVLGVYDPRKKENKVTLEKGRFDYWVKNGAVLSNTISEIVKERRT